MIFAAMTQKMRELLLPLTCCVMVLVSIVLICASFAVADEAITNPRIEVHKADRVLLLYDGEKLVRKYRIGLGFDPVSQKRREGDGATPEGLYRVCVKNPQSSYYLSLGINYPNLADGERGLASGLISKSEFDKIAKAFSSRTKPPWNTNLGGEIFIHGHGSSTNWTLGCVALENSDMEELYSAAAVGTEVLIKP